MKVLMFGWEFPPHISGGLGTACEGLTRALERESVDILFTIPKIHGGEQSDRTTFISASTVPIRQKKFFRPETTASGSRGIEKAETIRKIVSTLPAEKGDKIEVPSFLTAYASTAAHPFEMQQWNYSFDRLEQSEGMAFPSRTGSPSMQARFTKKRYAFSGSYGVNLLEEVERYAQVAGEIARRNTFDIIHTHDWMTFPAGIMAKKVSGKPLVVHVHATEVDRSGQNVNPAIFALEKAGMQQADRVVTVSQWTKNIAVNHYKIDERKILVIHNGISPRMETKVVPFKPPVGSRIVTFLGRVTHQKGPMYFVEAARKVHEQMPEVHFVVAGAGDQLPQMIERIAQVRLSEYFHFTGFVKGEDIDRVWAISDVYVMPSVSEPFGIAPLEAIQAGVPVIISKQAGVSEVMPHAIKVDFWDSDALAESIFNVLRYKSLADSLRKNSAEEIKTITWDKAAKKLMNLYYELSNRQEQPEKKSGLLFSGASTPPLAHAALF